MLLHFGAVDWESMVFLNGRELGSHRGGYDGFTLDLTKALKAGQPQELVVSAWDPTETSWHLHGKQVLRPAGCNYTASSGIWQTVWLEPVPMHKVGASTTPCAMRSGSSNSTRRGWWTRPDPWHGGGDIQDNHGGISRPNPKQIGLVSENGGYGVATPGHDWPCEIWTYRSYDAETGDTMDAMAKGIKGDRLPKLDEKSKAWFTRQVGLLYTELWEQKDSNGMTGQFFCQLYDTESECDGLVSYDRAVWKVDAEILSRAAKGKLGSAELRQLTKTAR